MNPLLRKELRALWPQTCLLALLTSADVVYRPFIERLDELEWSKIAADIEPGNGTGSAVALLIFGFVLAYSALPREHDERTIEFLYSLPITRRTVFLTKFLAAAIVLVLVHAFGHVTNALLLAWNPQSYSGAQFRWGIAGATLLVQSVFGLCVLCHGMLASFMRRFGLLPYAMLAWLVVLLGKTSPRFTWLNPLTLCEISYSGERVVLPWRAMLAHSAIAFAALVLAGLLWTGAAERVTELFSALRPGARKNARMAVPLGCATVLLVVVGLALLVYASVSSREPETPRDREVNYQSVRAQTAHLTFTYPANLRVRALGVMDAAEGLYAGVRSRLDHRGRAPEVVVDLTEVSAQHEGITAWTSVRMGLSGEQSTASRLRHVFAHEVTHAVEHAIMARRLGEQRDATLLFDEGLAEWLAYELEPDPVTRRFSRIVAAAAWERNRLSVEEVLDHARLRSRTDTNLVYPLGETLAQAMVDACGPRVLGDALRAMGRPEAPPNLSGGVYWQDVLQTTHCDLESVITAWDVVRAGVLVRERALIDAIPRMRLASVNAVGEIVRVEHTLSIEPPTHAGFVLRVRRDASTADNAVAGAEGTLLRDGRTVRFEIPREAIYGSRIDVSPGVVLRPHLWPLFEPWQAADVASARGP